MALSRPTHQRVTQTVGQKIDVSNWRRLQMEAFFQWLTSNSAASIILTAILSITIVTITVIYLVAFRQGREISFWPPKIGSSPNSKDKPTQDNSTSIKIFISHSSQDRELVLTLIQLLKSAFNIPSEEIRCTSLDGFRLPLGALVAEQIKTEVHGAKVLLALITPSSLSSSHFLFQLGARWGSRLPLYPLLAGGIDAINVDDWLRDINALDCNSEGQVLQMVRDVGKRLELRSEGTDSYLYIVKEFVNTSKKVAAEYTEWHGKVDKSTQQLSQAQMKTEDSDLAESDAVFWNITNKYYIECYRPKNDPDFPETLEALVRAAGAPPHTTEHVELIAWPSTYESKLNQDQRRIWNLAKQIYATHRSEHTGEVWEHSSIKPIEDAKRFHYARRTLGKYWDKWPPLVGYDFIRERYTTKRDIILLLAWLELALAQWTRMSGMHKQELFKLAMRFDKELKS
jgi:hypothetical protein